MSANLVELPANLPVPEDDGAADHLPGMTLPAITLTTTHGKKIRLADLQGLLVLYIYPMTGHPDKALPEQWDAIPGARGCTPQSCAFRDHYTELQRLGAGVHGISSQSSADQLEAKQRLDLPYELLSDANFQLETALGLPTFQASERKCYKRLTLITDHGRIRKCFYPIFPPDKNAADVIAWLQTNN